jgi:hypothetical protein
LTFASRLKQLSARSRAGQHRTATAGNETKLGSIGALGLLSTVKLTGLLSRVSSDETAVAKGIHHGIRCIGSEWKTVFGRNRIRVEFDNDCASLTSGEPGMAVILGLFSERHVLAVQALSLEPRADELIRSIVQ